MLIDMKVGTRGTRIVGARRNSPALADAALRVCSQADKDAQNGAGQTALHMAVEYDL